MSLPVELTPEAVVDLAEAQVWYDAQRPGLGDEMIEAVESTLKVIAENPGRFPVVHRQVRRALVRRFPYSVPFQEHNDRIVVLGVLHTSRNPQILRRRSK